MASADFDIQCYLTPSFTPGFGATVGWKRPFDLAYLNLGSGSDTLPGVHQYIPPQQFSNGLRADVTYIELIKTLDQGSSAKIVMTTASDRDIFEIANNEGTGHMLPRMKFPYRAWDINLKTGSDGSFPSPTMFRGMLTEAKIATMSDVKIPNIQDGIFQIELDFESFETFPLRNDNGAAMWHHRANSTTDGYHLLFPKNCTLTYDEAITRIVAWMNVGKPTSDFPHSYSYTPKGVAPYSNLITDVGDGGEIPMDNIPTWEALRRVVDHMATREALRKRYIPTCSIAGVIDFTLGGYDKTAAINEDFRTTTGMQKNTNTAVPWDFQVVNVSFTANANAEYWIDFILYNSIGTILYQTGYQYVPYDANNVHGRKSFKFPTYPAGTYKWDATLVTAGSFSLSATGSNVYSPASYSFLKSPTIMDYRKLKTFVQTQGNCSKLGIYYPANPTGCMGGGLIADGGRGKCPDQRGCYPDPLATPAETVNAKYGILGIEATRGSGVLQWVDTWNTVCRMNSKAIVECSQNTDTSIRPPVDATIVFNRGHSTDLVGKYLEIYSPELDDFVVVRCTSQKHQLVGTNLTTTMEGFRI